MVNDTDLDLVYYLIEGIQQPSWISVQAYEGRCLEKNDL